MPEIIYPPSIELARLPTPLEPIARLSAELGVELWVKRDDLTGCDLSGNKVRKLEFLLAEAREGGADTVITCGGLQSNHARATALACAKLGLQPILLLRTDPEVATGAVAAPAPDGNLLLDRLAGAEVRFITPDQYRMRGPLQDEVADSQRRAGRRPYVIPEGGSNEVGAWGYVRAIEELAGQAKERGLEMDAVVHAVGSGGTTAGLVVGRKLLGLAARIAGFAVCDDRDYFVTAVGTVVRRMIGTYQLDVPFSPSELEIHDGFVGLGYARSRPEELRLLAHVARTEGLVLDPVYTGKAFYGMVETLRKNRRAFGNRVVFLHTGGIFGLMAKAPELAAVL